MSLTAQNAQGTTITLETATPPTDALSRTAAELGQIVAKIAASDEWIGRVRLRADRRWYERLHHGPDHDVWLISWLPGQSTGFHDHGSSSGAFIVTAGVLEELHPDGRKYLAEPGKSRSFGPNYAHDVRNASDAPAISIHAYSPPLTEMNEYELDGGKLIPRNGARQQLDAVNENSRTGTREAEYQVGDSRVEQVLTAARARLQRMSPEEALQALTKDNAVLVDIRPASQRAIEGSVPGALIVERNVLEWRFDPTSTARLPIANSPDIQVIVFCSQGYASSLAAADLHDIGLWRATDIVGGFRAWRATSLPTEPPARICDE
jgi:rhodanese-related sulfurtransferase/quercetin dioxygenase-like cupin family protein